MRRALLIAFVLASVASASAQAAPVRTLAGTPRPIVHFAHDGNAIAWIDRRACLPVRIRLLARDLQRRVGSAGGGACTGYRPPGLAIGATRAVWGETFFGSTTEYLETYTAAFHERRPALVEELHSEYVYGGGLRVTALAGDGATLVYGLVEFNDCFCDDVSCPPCSYQPTGGGVRRLVGREVRVVPGAPPAVLVAAATGRIAVVPADPTPRPKATLTAALGGPVEIRDVRTGALLRAVNPLGTVRAVGLSRQTLAVLVDGPAGRAIERYDVASGLLRDRVSVSDDAAPEIDVANDVVVYRVGRAVRLVRANGTTTRIALARATPIGLSIEGGRVAWAENLRLGPGQYDGRIRAVQAPRR